MRYVIQDQATDANIKSLIEAAKLVEPEWETVIRCAYEAGIKTSIARHLGPAHLRGNQIDISHVLNKGSVWRTIPDEMCKYLQRLTVSTDRFCPRLHAMDYDQFANSWRDVRVEAGLHIQLLTLTWPYRNANRAGVNLERARSYLLKLGEDWLDETELQQILSDEVKWVRMGSKSGNRKRLLTRDQILAPFKNGTNGTNGSSK